MNYLVIHWCQESPQVMLNLSLWEQQHLSWQKNKVPLSQLAETLASRELAAATEIIVLIPGHWVNMTEVELPKRLPKKNLTQIIGYALESELLENIEDVHFILMDTAHKKTKNQGPNPKRPVAIISKEKLSSLQNQLSQQNVNPQVIMPDYFAIAAPSHISDKKEEITIWHASIIDSQALLRTQEFTGYSIEADQLAWLCQQLSGETDETNEATPGARIILKLYSTQTELPPNWPAELDDKITLQPQLGCSLEQCLSITALQTPVVDLSQTDRYKKPMRKRGNRAFSLWKICLYSFIALVIITFLSRLADHRILKNKNNETLDQIIKKSKSLMPNLDLQTPYSKNTIDTLKTKVQIALNDLQKSSSRNTTLRDLNSLDKLLTRPAVRINHIHYQNNQWTMELGIKTMTSLEPVIQSLTKQGWDITQSVKANPRADKKKDPALTDTPTQDNKGEGASVVPMPYAATLSIRKEDPSNKT